MYEYLPSGGLHLGGDGADGSISAVIVFVPDDTTPPTEPCVASFHAREVSITITADTVTFKYLDWPCFVRRCRQGFVPPGKPTRTY